MSRSPGHHDEENVEAVVLNPCTHELLPESHFNVTLASSHRFSVILGLDSFWKFCSFALSCVPNVAFNGSILYVSMGNCEAMVASPSGFRNPESSASW